MFSHMWEALDSLQPTPLLLSNCPAPKLAQPRSTPWTSVLGAGPTGSALLFHIPGQQETSH